ncbi:hypothetical protein K1T71_006034 [Dendrolimus kikuchii]|uniref:Uncharacterized protein n=1 Tax=Dendrolimus kikuchii TaxID=765133 RepID=A0ACC1D2Z0_9NEOP|nr:hypothetical protein K1T71_006034 [Dendrolimus kikuchii]
MKRLQHFCTWVFAKLWNFLKRKVFLILCIVGIIIIISRWRLICINMESQLKVQYICSSFAEGQSVGSLCHGLCQPQVSSSLSCFNLYMERNAVFSGVWMNNTVVFKTLKKSKINNFPLLEESMPVEYSSENEFSKLIKNTIKFKFNISINDVDAKRMSYIQYNQNGGSRHVEMENVWLLLQDNEYIALSLYEKFNLFPKLYGTCGSLYAVQKLNPISRFWNFMTLYDSPEEWEKRVKISVLILDYLLQLEANFPEPLMLCDVKMSHFGVTDDLKKVMYLDLDSVHPLSVANRITADGSSCKQHSDCDYQDCRSFCNLATKKCQFGVANNNLQIVCEKIFLGWVMSGRVIVPGLLVGPRTPMVLLEVLEKCANPTGEAGLSRSPTTKDIRKSLYTFLVHLTMI